MEGWIKEIQRALMAEDFRSLFYCTSHYVVGIYLWQLIPFYSLRPAFQNGLSGDNEYGTNPKGE